MELGKDVNLQYSFDETSSLGRLQELLDGLPIRVDKKDGVKGGISVRVAYSDDQSLFPMCEGEGRGEYLGFMPDKEEAAFSGLEKLTGFKHFYYDHLILVREGENPVRIHINLLIPKTLNTSTP